MLAALRVARHARCAGWRPGYIQFFQGTPLLIQLFMAYYGSSLLGYSPDPWTAAALTFCLNGAAFFGEIFRGAIQAIPEGPVGGLDARSASASSHAAPGDPSAGGAADAAADVGFMVQIVKATSVASLIGLTELARAATQSTP